MSSAMVTVFAHGDYLNGYIRHNLSKQDYVTVTGQFKYKVTIDDKGKKRHCGYILADAIAKNVLFH